MKTNRWTKLKHNNCSNRISQDHAFLVAGLDVVTSDSDQPRQYEKSAKIDIDYKNLKKFTQRILDLKKSLMNVPIRPFVNPENILERPRPISRISPVSPISPISPILTLPQKEIAIPKQQIKKIEKKIQESLNEADNTFYLDILEDICAWTK
jgi:hypothetical protein